MEVDREWYLQAYPDVAAAGLDPVDHYEKHGRAEGRQPCMLPVLSIERDLWANALNPEPYLSSLLEQVKTPGLNGIYARKVLAAFYLFLGRYKCALRESMRIIQDESVKQMSQIQETAFLIAFEATFNLREFAQAMSLLKSSQWQENNSKMLARQMMESEADSPRYLNKIYRRNGLYEVCFSNGKYGFDYLDEQRKRFTFSWLKPRRKTPTVSVIIPIFNADKTLDVAIRSIVSQSWPAVEIILIDDCSTDSSVTVARKWLNHNNITLIKNDRNRGAYATRNIGAKAANGDFVTVMDADDWSHPQKIEKQVVSLTRESSCVASVSHWARCDEYLRFTRLRTDNSWIYRNISSLMVRNEVFMECGYWDQLTANADTEFYLRLIANYGQQAVVEVYPDVPLSFGRSQQHSLTNNSATHVVSQFGGVRKEHLDYAMAWHSNGVKPLYFDIKRRPFPVPYTLLPDAEAEHNTALKKWRTALNDSWYVRAYSEVNNMGRTLSEHYWNTGEIKDYSPSPLFVPSAYRYIANVPATVSPTWHALSSGWDFSISISMKGRTSNRGKCIAMFSHSISKEIFGGELSFLDMVKACSAKGYRVFLFLPNAANIEYVDLLAGLCEKIYFSPVPWFHHDRSVLNELVEYFSRVFREHEIELAYINTIMLYEPYIAARDAGVISVTHIRELPKHDTHIRSLLGESAEDTRSRLISLADFFIANSELTASWLDANDRTHVIYNTVDVNTTPVALDTSGTLKVCMISSNVKKKGIEDFVRIASECNAEDIEFNLYGPVTDELKAALLKHNCNNINLHGYVKNNYEAIAANHIVLCLSWFQESFGRTAAEAMISKRVVIGYEWGAIPELVALDCGILCPHKNYLSVASEIVKLSNDRKQLMLYAENAHKRAIELFARHGYESKIDGALKAFIRSPRTWLT